MEHVESSNVFSHVSAAVIHGLPVNWKDLKLVTMIRRTPGHGNGGPQLRVRNTRLASSEVEVLDGLPVTTLERTVCDLARLSPFEWGVVAADAALHRGHSADMLKATLWAHPRLHGVAKAKRVLSFADGLSESPAESISRVAMARFGLPTPVLQFEIFDDDDGVLVARSDFGWLDLGVVGEVDGKVKYSALLRPGQPAADVVMHEKEQEQRIRRCGYWPVRWGGKAANDGRQLAGIVGDAFRNALPRGA